jgi:hypothetical protein
MLIISSPTAQSATDTLRIEPPPSLTVRAEYGGFVLEGNRYTSAHQQSKGSPYSEEHSHPALDEEIPLLEEHEVALIKEVDLETLSGLMRADGNYVKVFSEHKDFWENIVKPTRLDPRVLEIKKFLAENKPKEAIYNQDVTDFCYKAFSFISETLQKEIEKEDLSWVTSYPYNVVARRSKDLDVSNMLVDPLGYKNDVCICYIEKERKIIVYSELNNINCREFAIKEWGIMVGGDSKKAWSPSHMYIEEYDFISSAINLVSFVKDKTYF